MSASPQIKPLLISALETALNQYLSLDTHLEQLLAPIAGKVIAIRITPFDETIYLCPNQQNIQILDSYYRAVDATLSGSLSALGLMSLSATPMHTLFKGEVRIEGDPEAARKLQSLFRKLDIDPEGKLAAITGERFASRLSNFLQGGFGWGRHSLETFRLNLAEFLQEETRELPAKAEAEHFFRQVDACRNDYDRLKARLERLEAALDSTRTPQNR